MHELKFVGFECEAKFGQVIKESFSEVLEEEAVGLKLVLPGQELGCGDGHMNEPVVDEELDGRIAGSKVERSRPPMEGRCKIQCGEDWGQGGALSYACGKVSRGHGVTVEEEGSAPSS